MLTCQLSAPAFPANAALLSGKSKKQLSTDPDGKAGQLELLAIFAVSVLRTWHSNRMVFVKRNLMAATYSR